jgi:hypothetical protein
MTIFTNFAESRCVTNITCLSPCPVHISAFITLPIICVEQATRFFRRRFANLSTKFLFERFRTFRFLFIATITGKAASKVYVPTIGIATDPVAVVHFDIEDNPLYTTIPISQNISEINFISRKAVLYKTSCTAR